MRRPSFTVIWIPSLLHQGVLVVRDVLHSLLVVLADTLPGVSGYDIYSPTILYRANNRERTSEFPLSLRFHDGHTEFWASTYAQRPDRERPLELARRAHAEDLNTTYRLFTEGDLHANPVLLQNRKLMHGILTSWTTVDTASLELDLLMDLPLGQPRRLDDLWTRPGREMAAVRLAVFRLIRAGILCGDLEHLRISGSWIVWRTNHVWP